MPLSKISSATALACLSISGEITSSTDCHKLLVKTWQLWFHQNWKENWRATHIKKIVIIIFALVFYVVIFLTEILRRCDIFLQWYFPVNIFKIEKLRSWGDVTYFCIGIFMLPFFSLKTWGNVTHFCIGIIIFAIFYVAKLRRCDVFLQ